MGVYIKGMEMPKNCAWCRFLQSTDPIPKRELFCGVDNTNDIHDYKPDKGCPLIEVPEHGRLIDGTDLYAILDGGYDVNLDELPETKDALLSMIQSAETIIPAEEVDDG